MHKNTFFAALILAGLCFAVSTAQVGAAACSTAGSTVKDVILTGTGCTLPSVTTGGDGATSESDTANTGSVTIPTGSSIILNSGDRLVYGTGGLKINGSISKNSGAQMVKGGIWVTDVDADGWYVSGTESFSVTKPVNKIRKFAAAGIDANDASGCRNGSVVTCQYCANGITVNATNGTDPNNYCSVANTACVNGCKVTQRTGNCNGAGACATATVNVGAGQLCSGAGSISTAQCAAGYNCNGRGNCCYTDIYGEHCIW